MVNQKKALKRLWRDKLAVVEYQEKTKPNGATGHEEVTILEDEPCKVSLSTLKEVGQNGTGASVVQVTKLFCDNELEIKAGSKIVVRRDGREFVYSRSGEPGIFTFHQEIVLVPFKGWA